LGKNFDEVAPKIGALVEKLFPDRSIRVIAEPGRYICESVCFLASRIIGKKVLGSGKHHYYVNNGIYTGYTVRVFGEEQYVCAVDKSIEKRKKHTTTFWGQTCDSCDFILKDK
jgi:diaminopimelate decarboxylase